MNWKRVAYLIYPFLIGFLLPVIFLTFGWQQSLAMAGVIRKADISSDRPLTVRLALGRSTAISFGVRPERVVPGNPQALEINFLGRDLTLRPLASKPGNLIIYTKSSRYVILLQVVSEVNYDDAVVVNSVSATSRPLRLSDDTFAIEELKLEDIAGKTENILTGTVRHQGQFIEFENDSLPNGIKCKGCVLKKQKTGSTLFCVHPVQTLECQAYGKRLRIKRVGGS